MKHKDIQIHMTHAALAPEEKDMLRQEIIRRMRLSNAARPAFGYGHFWRHLRIAATSAISAALIGVGISYAAENALPGDILYAVKIEINERMRTWIALSQEAEAEWTVTRTTRRLEELERLATAGDLNDIVRDQIATRLEQNTEDANKAIESLKKEQITAAANTSSRLESSLRIHEQMLMQVAEERADVSSQIHIILDTVRKKAESVSEIRQEIEKELANIKTDEFAKDAALENVDATSTLPIENIEIEEQKKKREEIKEADGNIEKNDL